MWPYRTRCGFSTSACRMRKIRLSVCSGSVGADGCPVRPGRSSRVERLECLAQQVAGVLAAIQYPGFVRRPVAGVDRGGADADRDALPPVGAEIVGRDRATDLVGGE